MNNKIWNYFEIAGKLASYKAGEKSFLLAACAHRGDGAFVSAVNSISQQPNRLLHAEKRICNKLDYGATVYVARVRLLDGEFALSKPCFSCEKALRSKRVARVYYTIDQHNFGVLEF